MSRVMLWAFLALAVFSNQHWVNADEDTNYRKRPQKQSSPKRSSDFDDNRMDIKRHLEILADADGNGMSDVDFKVSQVESSLKDYLKGKPLTARSTDFHVDKTKTKRRLEVLSKAKGNGMSDVDFDLSQVSALREGEAISKITGVVTKRSTYLTNKMKRDFKILANAKGNGMSNVTFNVTQATRDDDNKPTIKRSPPEQPMTERSSDFGANTKQTKRYLEILSDAEGNGMSNVGFKISQVAGNEQPTILPPQARRSARLSDFKEDTKRDLEILSNADGNGMSDVDFKVSQVKPNLKRYPLAGTLSARSTDVDIGNMKTRQTSKREDPVKLINAIIEEPDEVKMVKTELEKKKLRPCKKPVAVKKDSLKLNKLELKKAPTKLIVQTANST
ncbi:uncharacterized protein LOC121383872 [Gigantopelta aegis]|uniref:uncharacterized protein LOC121383872 n=1 Tax=Gigantopelta aegis TaxID=1735272 RepID=UPI001B888150|nr:uncharacterized protein LOC121383872 [Gigantopelta aegis]